MLHVLTYHALDEARGPTSTSPALFARQLDELTAAGFLLVTLSEGLRRHAAGEAARLVALTFDDGYASAAEIAAPLLAARGAAATIFPVAGHVGGDNRWPSQPPRVRRARLLGWDELRALTAAGWEVGAHGETHADLTRLEPSALARELGARERLGERLGAAVAALAYPYGRSNPRVRAAARAVGYRWGVTTDLREVGGGFDPLAVPRVDACYLRRRGRAGSLGTTSSRAFLAVRRAGRALRGASPALVLRHDPPVTTGPAGAARDRSPASDGRAALGPPPG